MERIVLLGKGGTGKSTVAANLSVTFAQKGLRVLHVGCDPKHDSTLRLTNGEPIETFMDKLRSKGRVEYDKREDLVVPGLLGIDCVEAGGPEPGVGCAGRGISLTLEALRSARLLSDDHYDVVIFDVLGDVVCGGLAAPLRKGFGQKVAIIVSQDDLALYAANNIAKAIKRYANNGVFLAGIVSNREAGGLSVERFAKAIGTQVLVSIAEEPALRRTVEKPVVQSAEHRSFARSLATLAEALLATSAASCPLPTPMTDADFLQHLKMGEAA